MPQPPNHLAWVRYPLGAALFELLRVSPAAELAHRRMQDYYWQTGQWPSTRHYDAAALARVRPGRWKTLRMELQRLGWREHHGRIENFGVHPVRADAVSSLKLARTSAAEAPTGVGGSLTPRHRLPLRVDLLLPPPLPTL